MLPCANFVGRLEQYAPHIGVCHVSPIVERFNLPVSAPRDLPDGAQDDGHEGLIGVRKLQRTREAAPSVAGFPDALAPLAFARQQFYHPLDTLYGDGG